MPIFIFSSDDMMNLIRLVVSFLEKYHNLEIDTKTIIHHKCLNIIEQKEYGHVTQSYQLILVE